MTSVIDIPIKITTDKKYTKMRKKEKNGNTCLHFNVLWSDNSTTVEPLLNFLDNEDKTITDKLIPHLYHYKIIADSKPKNINKCWLCKNNCTRGVRVAKCLCTDCLPTYKWIYDVISEYKPMHYKKNIDCVITEHTPTNYKRKKDSDMDDLITKLSRSSIDDIISSSFIKLKSDISNIIDNKETYIKTELLDNLKINCEDHYFPKPPPPSPDPSPDSSSDPSSDHSPSLMCSFDENKWQEQQNIFNQYINNVVWVHDWQNWAYMTNNPDNPSMPILEIKEFLIDYSKLEKTEEVLITKNINDTELNSIKIKPTIVILEEDDL